MAGASITDYLQKEEETLLQLSNDYRFQAKTIDGLTSTLTLHTLLEHIQEHALYQERVFFPLAEKISNGTDVKKEIEPLKKEHASMCELISTMLKNEEEGLTSRREYEALHVLLVNHLQREADVLSNLDEYLSDEEKQAAISLEAITR